MKIDDWPIIPEVRGKTPIDKGEIHRILIRATNWVGDVVMTLPALEAVRENFPSSTLSVMARPWVVPLLESHPAVNEVLPIRTGGGFVSHMGEVFRAVGLIQRRRFDLAILFQNAFEAALMVYLGGVRFRVGYDTDARGFLLSHAVVREEAMMRCHQVDYYLSIARAMGWEAESRDPVIHISPEDRERAGTILVSHDMEREDFMVGLSPGAVYGPAKRWPPERFAEIGNRVVERWGARVLIMGSQAEREICRAVSRIMRHPSVNVCGDTTLGEAMALVERCGFFVTNDSGLMHVAAALNVPLVAVFGSTDPAATGPRSQRTRIIRHAVDCAPCLKSECPRDSRCLMEIGPDEVWLEMEGLKRKLEKEVL